MEFEHLSIQELRQTLRERGGNSRGSKKQLLARVAEQYGLRTPADRAAAAQAAPAKVRVSIQKSRSACCALLVDPSLPAEHNLQLILRKASTKFRFKPGHLIVIGGGAAAGGGAVELHAGNLHQYLKDGLTVLASVFPASAQSPSAVAALPGPAEGAEETEADAGMASLQLGPNSSNTGADSSRGGPASESKEESQLSRSRLMTDSGSCSSEYDHDNDPDHEAANEMAERASLKSFDSDSLYSFHTAELHPHPHTPSTSTSTGHAASALAPGLGYAQQSSSSSGGSGGHHVSSRGWKWMLPKASDQLQQSCSSQVRPPPHPHSPLLQPASASASVIAVPAFSALPLPLAAHTHRNHRCNNYSAAVSASAGGASSSSPSDAAAATATAAASSSTAAAAPSCAASSIASAASHLPSIMDELNALPRSKPPRSANVCECCDAGCELDFSSRPGSPVVAPSQQLLTAPPAQHSYLLQRSYSTPTASASSSLSASPDSAAATAGSPSPIPPGLSSSPPASAAAASSMPPAHPGLLLSASYSSSLDALRAGLGPNPDEASRRLLSALADSEKRARRAESSLKAHLRSESDLRSQLAALREDSSRFEALHSQFRSAQLSLDLREKDAAKLVWERDRLRLKNKTLMERNNELKADSEALAALRKEHAQLSASYARLSGQNVNSSTSPAVLQELLLHHAAAIERVHKQMATNLAAERAALKESRSCKVCMRSASTATNHTERDKALEEADLEPCRCSFAAMCCALITLRLVLASSSCPPAQQTLRHDPATLFAFRAVWRLRSIDCQVSHLPRQTAGQTTGLHVSTKLNKKRTRKRSAACAVSLPSCISPAHPSYPDSCCSCRC